MLIVLIIDFFKNIKNKKAIINIIIFGCAVLISLPVLIYQNSILFESDSGNSIEFGCMTILKMYHNYPIISLIQSATFPLFILITNFKTIIKKHEYSFVALMNVFGLFEFLFLQENGVRLKDGNFTWQYLFTLFLAFVFSVIILDNRRKAVHTKNKIYFVICYMLLVLHLLSGIFYFTRLLMGYNYF